LIVGWTSAQREKRGSLERERERREPQRGRKGRAHLESLLFGFNRSDPLAVVVPSESMRAEVEVELADDEDGREGLGNPVEEDEKEATLRARGARERRRCYWWL